MTKRFRLRVLAVAGLAAVLLAGEARAASITFIDPFSSNSPAALVDFTAFDPALGTLDSVFVQVTVSAATATVLAPPLPSGVAGVFVPYQFTVALDVGFEGLGGQFFEFGFPGYMTTTELALTSGVGEVVLVPFAPFGLSASFDAGSDFIGFTLPAPTAGVIPPATINAVRDDFLLAPATIESLLATQAVRILGTSGPLPSVLSSAMAGTLSVTYHYTPVPAVPEPGLALLVSMGAVTVGWRRLRPRR
jgi:hypothetical protein